MSESWIDAVARAMLPVTAGECVQLGNAGRRIKDLAQVIIYADGHTRRATSKENRASGDRNAIDTRNRRMGCISARTRSNPACSSAMSFKFERWFQLFQIEKWR